MIELKQVRKSYGLNGVLDIEYFKLSTGIFWVSGKNGSGKSTLLKIMAGILAFEGDVLLDETLSVKRNPIKFRRLVNFAEAEPVFPGFLTGQDLIKLFSSAKSAPKAQEKYFIEKMNMSDYLRDPIGTYSSGMLKKLSLALAFLGKPRLILLDEPLTTIDSDSLEALYGVIGDLHMEGNVTFILASHQHVERSLLSTKKILLKDRRLVIE
ncbi:MAG: ABC transporter ATP-binding protein [Bacteroidota bacterium]